MSVWSSDGLTVYIAKIWKELNKPITERTGSTQQRCLSKGKGCMPACAWDPALPLSALTFKACVQKAHIVPIGITTSAFLSTDISLPCLAVIRSTSLHALMRLNQGLH